MTTIPLEIASAVADACPEFMAAEVIVLDYLKGGKVDVEATRRSGTIARIAWRS